MTEPEKITYTQKLIGEDCDTPESGLVSTYLSLAKQKMLSRLYPFGGAQNIPDQYHATQCELAARLYLRRGAEGELSHSENGVSRSYGSVDDSDILNRLIPRAGVF